MAHYMNEIYESKKYGIDKIAFLGMFIISILIAQLIVTANSKIIFSDRIELAHSGLSLSIPIGRGWQSTGKWQYENNTFVLRSSFIHDAAAVECQYLPTPYDQYASILSDPNIEVVEKGLIQKDNLEILWAHYEKTGTIYPRRKIGLYPSAG